MIAISKEEAQVIRERFPNVHIVRTMRQRSNRHRYYCEEQRGVIRAINNMRNGFSVGQKNDGGGYYRNGKNAERVAV